MKILIYIVSSFFLLVILFILWRWTSVGRGAKQRDNHIFDIIDPIGTRIDAGENVTKEEIIDFAKRPELRHILYTTLRHLKRSDLIPNDFNSEIHQAESSLCYWMMHPNELQDPPEVIEFIKTLTKNINNKEERFHFFKYKMQKDHWAIADWLIGFVGPIEVIEEPYQFTQNAFSRADDVYGKITCEEILEWWIGIMKAKGMVTKEGS